MKGKREKGFGRPFWSDHVARQAASGKTQTAYAAQNGIKHQTLSAWVNKLAREARGASGRAAPRKLGRSAKPSDAIFTKFQVARSAKRPLTTGSHPATPMRLVFPGGVALELAGGFDATAVAQLISAAGGQA